jgi:hypothetical protein
MSYSLFQMSRLKEYVGKRGPFQNKWLEYLDISWRIILPIIFGYISLIAPIDFLCWFFRDANQIKSFSSYYFYSFIPSFFLSLFLLIKVGKIKVKGK